MEDAANDYLLGLEAVFPYADYITINISSPNTKNLRQLQSDEALDRLLFSLKKMQASLALKHKRRVPLFLKIAPDLDPSEISRIANSVRQHDIEGVIATNTTVSRHQVAQYAHAEETGGLSGAPLLETANAVLRQLRGVLPKETCLIGVGGVVSGADAAEKIQAGADLVQVYTGLIYRGPALVSDAVRATRSA
jgi:dihydroorotate dehydrogenase